MPPQQLGDGENAVVPAVPDVIQQLRRVHPVEFGQIQVVGPDFQAPDGLQQALLEGPAHRHNLAGGLHLGVQLVGSGGELIEGEPGHFRDHIVQGRLKRSGGVGDLNFVQRHAHGDFCADPGDGVAGGLGGQSRGPGHPGIHLDEVVVEGLGVQGKLDVAPAFDFQLPDDFQCAVPEQVILFIGQGLAGTHHDGVAGMNAHRVNVLHIAYRDDRVGVVPHDLVLDLFIAPDALFHQHLMDRRELQSVFHDFPQLGHVVGKAAAGAAQGEGRPQDHRITDLLRRLLSLRNGMGDLRGQHRFPDALAQLLELLPVLSHIDGIRRSTQ